MSGGEGSLWLIRHGQTDGNGRRYVGWEDAPLNGTGELQAAAIAATLAEQPPAAIYASPLRRARDTAAPLARALKLPIALEPDLREIHYGDYQGQAKSELQLKLRKHYLHRRLPAGESLHDVYRRACRFRQRIAADLAAARSVAVFGHYWSIRLVLGALTDTSFDALFRPGGYKPANGSIYHIRYRPWGASVTLVAAGYREARPGAGDEFPP